jgi:hypothetical protein
VLAAAALHGGTEPDLLDEVAWWQTDEFWQYALFAAVAFIRAAASPDLHLTIANRMVAGEFVVDEQHVPGLHFGDMPTEITALSVYRVTSGKIASLMLLF